MAPGRARGVLGKDSRSGVRRHPAVLRRFFRRRAAVRPLREDLSCDSLTVECTACSGVGLELYQRFHDFGGRDPVIQGDGQLVPLAAR